MSIFPTANQARQGSRNNAIIHNEIRYLEGLILASIGQRQYMLRVSDSHMTSMISGKAYFNAWQNIADAPDLVDQMDMVIKYFTDLQYSVVRKTNGASGNTFVWEIRW